MTSRRLAAILAADVAGYSRLMASDEGGTIATFRRLRCEVIEPRVTIRHGRVVGSAGDSLLVEFGSAIDAVQCAIEIQSALCDATASQPSDHRMTFRMGVNLGDVVSEDATIHGDGVNVAARLEKLANPGGIVISRSVHEQIRGKLLFRFEDMGEQVLHNIAQPVRAYRVLTTEPASPDPTSRSEDARRRQSIAVLPFTNMSGDPEQEYFSDGITEDLITALARHHALFVIARNSSFVFKGRAASIPEVGRQLGVRYVVEGSVRKSGKRIRVTAQLIDAETGAHVWAERYDRDLEDVFTVQDEIVETLVWRVAGHVARVELERVKSRRTESMDAYDLMLRGISVFERATPENIREAGRIWRRASKLDPNWGRPLSHIAAAHMALGFDYRDSQDFDRAIETAQHALALTDAEDWTDALIGYVAAWRGDFKLADMHFDRAMARNPLSAMSLAFRAYSRYWRGDAKGAIEIGLSLRRLDPLDRGWVNDLLGYAYYVSKDYEASLEAFQRCMPFAWWANHGYLAACLGQLGRNDEATTAWRQMLALRPEFSVEKFVGVIAVREREDKEHWRAGLLKAGLE